MVIHSRRLAITLFTLACAFYGTAVQAAPRITEPADNATINLPNHTVDVIAAGLLDNTTYLVKLKLQLTENGPFGDVGSTGTFEGDENGDYDTTVDVEYNPGPGNYAGKAVPALSDLPRSQIAMRIRRLSRGRIFRRRAAVR